MSVIFKELCKFAILDFWGREFILGQAGRKDFTLQETEKAATPYGETARYMICHTSRGVSMGKTLFALHKLVGLRHAIIEFSTAIHVDTRLNGLIQALHERADGLQEREVCIGLEHAHIVRRGRA